MYKEQKKTNRMAYYDKKSVDNCLEAIQTWGYAIRSPDFMALIECRLKPEKPLY